MDFLSGIWQNVKGNFGVTYGIVGWKAGELLLEFDTIEECTTAGRASVTQYPTEYGDKAIDYKYSEPDTVTMTGILSEGGALGVNSIWWRMGTWDRKSAIKQVRETLQTLKSNMTLVNILTRNAGLRTRLTLVNYEIDETYDTYGTMSVSMTFQEVPLFNQKGEFVKSPSDSKTQNGGITMTQRLGQ